jgi:predicted transcriptional regulator
MTQTPEQIAAGLTEDELLEEFRALFNWRGCERLTAKQWADEHGFSQAYVSDVLRGKRGSRSMVEVTQEDRLLVADILDEVSDLLDHTGIGQVADLIRDGEYDEHDCVVIATHHRIAAENAALERAAKVADEHCYMIDIDEWMAMTKKEHGAYACRSVATAIRALKGPTDDPA